MIDRRRGLKGLFPCIISKSKTKKRNMQGPTLLRTESAEFNGDTERERTAGLLIMKLTIASSTAVIGHIKDQDLKPGT